MKLSLLSAALALCLMATTTFAATPTPPATAPNTQNNRMKACAEQYHVRKIPKDQYKAFMSDCLKNNKTSVSTTVPAPATGVTTPATALSAPTTVKK